MASEAAYAIGNQRWARNAPGFVEAIAKAYQNHLRPRCLCQPGGPGVDMYVARILNGYAVKRMPNTGCQHATNCPSFEPPTEFSGIGPLVGTAIVENPVTGMTTLKLDFPMSKLPGRAAQPPSARASNSVVANGHRLGLRALLHYLWDQGELTHWKPGFAGRRTWGTVRKHLLQASENKFVHGHALLGSLYIPEVFSATRRQEIDASRLMQWANCMPHPGQPQRLLLMIAEVKEITPARVGHRMIIKHLPDLPLWLSDLLSRRIYIRFERELMQWSMNDSLRLIIITTLSLNEDRSPTIHELSLMIATSEWLPIDDEYEKHLVYHLVIKGRSFIKSLRYDNTESDGSVCATLLDCGENPIPLFICRTPEVEESSFVVKTSLRSKNLGEWAWAPHKTSTPELLSPIDP